MKRLHTMLWLTLAGCSKVHKIGMRSLEGSIQESLLPSEQPPVCIKETVFTASGGHLVSFLQQDGIWVAMVDKKLPSGFSNRVKLRVSFEERFCLETLSNYSPQRQQNLIHIEQTSDG